MNRDAPGPLALLALVLLTACRSFDVAPLPGGNYRLRPPSEGPAIDEWLSAEILTEREAKRAIVHVHNDASRCRILILEADSMLTLLDATQGKDAIESKGPMAEALRARSAAPFALLQLGRWPLVAVRAGLAAGDRLEREHGVTTLRDGKEVAVRIREFADHRVEIEIPAYRIRAVLQPDAR